MHHVGRTTLIVGALGLLATLAIACSGSSGPTLETYLKNTERTDQQHEAVAQPLWNQLDTMMSSLNDTDKLPAEATTTFTKLFTQEDDFASAIEKQKPAKEAKAIQTEAVAALRAEAAYGREVLASVTPTTTLADISAKMQGERGTAVQDRRHNACLGIQKLADDHSIKVDMTC